MRRISSRRALHTASVLGLTALLALSISAALATAGGPQPVGRDQPAGKIGFSRVGAASAGQARPHRSRRCRRDRHRNHKRRGFTPSPPRCPRDPSTDLVTAHLRADAVRHVTRGPYQPGSAPPGGNQGDAGEEIGIPLPAGPFIPHAHERLNPPPSGGVAAPTERPASAHASVVGDIEVPRNRSLRSISMPVASSLQNLDGGESSVASNGKVVLFTSNNADALSTDGGYSFTYLDPTTIFPAAAGGFCCDQVVAYIPRIRRFVWVLQYNAGSGGTYNKYSGNVIRVATATTRQVLDSGGKAWTYYDWSPADFGVFKRPGRLFRYRPNLDRPHVAFSRLNLYLTSSIYGSARAKGDEFKGTAIWRVPLTQLGKGTINYGWAHIPGDGVGKVRPAQDAYTAKKIPSPTQWFAGNASSSRIDVFEWHDGEGVIHVHEVDVPSIGTEDTSSLSPSRENWMERWGKQAGQVETGAQVGNSLVFGWMAGRKAKVFRDGKEELVQVHDQPALDFVLINIDAQPLRRIAGLSVEFANYGAALPQVRANADGTLGLSYVYGGPSRYVSHAVGFLVGWATALTVSGDVDGNAIDVESAPGPFETQRGGDYLGLTIDPSQPNCFVASGAASRMIAGTPNAWIDPHYILFGRASAGCKAPPGHVRVTFPPAPKPDLVVSNLYMNGDAGWRIYADISNTGAAAAPASKTRFAQEGQAQVLIDTPALAAGATVTVSAECVYGGLGNATADADVTEAVAESNEANNSASITGAGIGGICRYP